MQEAIQEVIQVEDRYYILATSDRAADLTRVLKQGETFAIFDCHGDIHPFGLGEQGIFHEGTRFLSSMELRLGEVRPLLVGSTINEQNELLAVDLMNPDFVAADDIPVRRDSVHIFRSKFIWQGSCFEQMRFTNFSLGSVKVPVILRFNADFADIFEVRGMKRRQKGKRLATIVNDSSVILSYEGLDGAVRRTKINFSPHPEEVHASEVRYQLTLEPKESIMLNVTVTCECMGCETYAGSYQTALLDAKETFEELKHDNCEITTSNEQFNGWLRRSRADLFMMLTKTPYGLYPYAGVPWFSTTFGRDGIITALETIWMNPSIARGVLSYLAHTQAMEVNDEQDCEPGKIIHETRLGEMAALGEIPFGHYYGSVDSTPLFIVLAGAYYERTADKNFLVSIWPNIRRALDWIDIYGDGDRDGFVEYARHSPEGLVQQGWKDSSDSVFHADGTLAEAPIALCEVQGYVYDAKIQGAKLAEVFGEMELGAHLRSQAESLREKFHNRFWCDDLSFYALALDGNKRPCRVRTSNAGHCLFSGILDKEHATAIAEQLVSNEFFSGWGIRTVATTEALYNPMSYHNGSIWPHDNALIASGLARYGFTQYALTVLESLFSASLAMDLHRLPELFSGFKRRPGLDPILYPLACAPQSWAAASVFLLLQACIGLSLDAVRNLIHFRYPVLPAFIDELRIRNLKVRETKADILLKRYHQDVTVSVLRKEGSAEVVIVK